jgi:tetratricopeptide (TPR) repeat protein
MARLAARALDGKESVPGSAAFWTLQTAVIFRGWGEHAEAERLLDRLDTMGDKTGPQMKILASGVRRGIELERKYQVQAVERLEKAVAAGRLPPKKGEEGEEEAGREPSKAVPPGDIAALAYRAGETWRRLGEREKAIRWFRRVFEETEAEEEIQDFALKGLLDCGAGEGRFPERIEEQKKTRISRLLGELENSETYFMAEEKLAALRDRRHAIPRLLEMLGSTDSMGLRSSLIPLLEDQDPAAVKAWESWWKDNREQPRREWIAAGFQAAGYSTGPASAPGSLIVLTRALSDKRPCVKWNAEAELRKRTGTDPYGPLTRETAFVTRRGACLAWFYRRWLALHRDGLRWDEEAGRFLLREEGK